MGYHELRCAKLAGAIRINLVDNILNKEMSKELSARMSLNTLIVSKSQREELHIIYSGPDQKFNFKLYNTKSYEAKLVTNCTEEEAVGKFFAFMRLLRN